MADTGTGTTPATVRGSDGGGGSAPARRFYGWWIVAALSITQTVGYGVLFYAFAVFLTPMQRDLHASASQVTGALTVALLIAAVAAVPVGRWLDRHGGRALMTTGSIAGTLLVIAWSSVHSLIGLYLVFAGIGLVHAMVLYEPAFAVIVTWFRRRRANALLAVTVVAGFASTIFMPLTGWLTDAYGWRHALLILAGLYAILTIPLHALIRRPSEATPSPAGLSRSAGGRVAGAQGAFERSRVTRSALHDPVFWALTVAFLAHSAAVTVIGVHLVAYLLQLGHPGAFAATVTGLIGILSVTGRLTTTVAQRHRSPTTVVAVIFAFQAVAALTLPIIGRAPGGAIVCVLLLGLGFGVATIAKPALLVDLYGTAAYGTISGLMAAPLTLAKAAAPLAAALLLNATGSYTPVMATVSLSFAIAAAGLLTAGHVRRTRPARAVRPASSPIAN